MLPIGILRVVPKSRATLLRRQRCRSWRRRSDPHARGFTLVEVCVAVAIMALATAVVIPSLNNLTRADLRRGARALSSTIRSAYAEAALTGEVQRIVFTLGDLEKHRLPDAPPIEPIRLEQADAALQFDGQAGALVAAADLPNGIDSLGPSPFDVAAGKAPAASADANRPRERTAFEAFGAVNQLGRAEAEAHFQPKGALRLPSTVRVTDILVEGMTTAMVEGEAALVFFGHGTTQDATLHLADGGQSVMTLKVQALTGRVEILDGYVEGNS